MGMEERVQVDKAKGDGGDAKAAPEFVAELLRELQGIAGDQQSFAQGDRADAEDTRLCRWDGQASDGLKHAWANDDEEPEPFDGATDMRVRLTDLVVNEEVALLVTAAMRAQMTVDAVEGTNDERAGVIELLLRWALRNHMGVRWMRELMRLVQFAHGDQPGVALLKVTWARDEQMRMERVSLDALMKMYVARVEEELQGEEVSGEGAGEDLVEAALEAVQAFEGMLADPGSNEEGLAVMLQEFFPGIRPGRARRVVRELRRSGESEFPVPVVVREGPEVMALRLGDGWHVPMATRDFERARVWFEVEWLTRTELEEEARKEGWSETWVEKVLQEEGRDAVPMGFQRTADGRLRMRGEEFYRGLFQVVTAYWRAVNEDGVRVMYFTRLNGGVGDEAAHDPRVLGYAHGEWPGVVYSREVLSDRLLDSRGWPEVLGAHQGLLKMFVDSFGDHAQIAGVPPVVTRGRRKKGALRLRPLVELPATREGDYRYLEPPRYPQAVEQVMREIRRQVDEYAGRTNEDVAPEVVGVHRLFKVTWFLQTVRGALQQMVSLIQQYMPEEQVAAICQQEGVVLTGGRADISGKFSVDIHFDPADLDVSHLEKVAGMIQKVIMPLDREQTMLTAPVVKAFMWRLVPEVARRSLRQVDEAQTAEMEDEVKRYQEIRSGLEPELPDDGSVNYQVRGELYARAQELNPAIFDDLAEDKRKILESRMQRLKVLGEQYGANVQIGREGGRRGLG
jgi:hypothetical protein